jgi:hypothetical protein
MTDFFFTPLPGEFTQGTTPAAQGIGGWVGPRADVDAMENRKISCLRQESNPYFSVVHPEA